ncbi:hypothetical protein WJX72_005344 [[Myrmecia] bisecta]|uniref:AP5B1 middle domain-containing protein n=1 Tax=[Myrmecia] bisecta TaxID=41462 RepID=A0AAW1Q7A5_9CHLO
MPIAGGSSFYQSWGHVCSRWRMMDCVRRHEAQLLASSPDAAQRTALTLLAVAEDEATSVAVRSCALGSLSQLLRGSDSTSPSVQAPAADISAVVRQCVPRLVALCNPHRQPASPHALGAAACDALRQVQEAHPGMLQSRAAELLAWACPDGQQANPAVVLLAAQVIAHSAGRQALLPEELMHQIIGLIKASSAPLPELLPDVADAEVVMLGKAQLLIACLAQDIGSAEWDRQAAAWDARARQVDRHPELLGGAPLSWSWGEDLLMLCRQAILAQQAPEVSDQLTELLRLITARYPDLDIQDRASTYLYLLSSLPRAQHLHPYQQKVFHALWDQSTRGRQPKQQPTSTALPEQTPHAAVAAALAVPLAGTSAEAGTAAGQHPDEPHVSGQDHQGLISFAGIEYANVRIATDFQPCLPYVGPWLDSVFGSHPRDIL